MLTCTKSFLAERFGYSVKNENAEKKKEQGLLVEFPFSGIYNEIQCQFLGSLVLLINCVFSCSASSDFSLVYFNS